MTGKIRINPIGQARAGSVAWQSAEGKPQLTVVCRVTFQLAPGTLALARVQEHPSNGDTHYDGSAEASAYVCDDFVPFKRSPEVVLVGKAFAREPARSVHPRLCFMQLDKTIEVVADRWWDSSGQLCEGKRFTEMALRWENAAYDDALNPVGRVADAADEYGRRWLPNLQPIGSVEGEFVRVVGFGPIAKRWPTRRARGVDDGWLEHWSSAPMPSRIDRSVFNTAPREQFLEQFAIDERLVLENLHCKYATLDCRLPGIKPRAFVQAEAVVKPVVMEADTLWIDAARSICTVTWRGTFHVSAELERSKVHIALENPGEPLSWADVQRMANPERTQVLRRDLGSDKTAAIEDATLSPPLPFHPAKPGASPPSSASPEASDFGGGTIAGRDPSSESGNEPSPPAPVGSVSGHRVSVDAARAIVPPIVPHVAQPPLIGHEVVASVDGHQRKLAHAVAAQVDHRAPWDQVKRGLPKKSEPPPSARQILQLVWSADECAARL